MVSNINSPVSVVPENNVLQSFGDAIAGRSLQLYYALSAVDDSGDNYLLVRDQSYSKPLNTTVTSDALGVLVDVDFDITINKPTIFAGSGSVDINWIPETSVNPATIVSKVICTLYHYDGSTETSIGTVTSADETTVLDAATIGEAYAKLELFVTRKLFAIGDTLRFNVQLNMISHSANGVRLGLWHDPTTAGHELKIWLPVVNLEGS